jgi:hypothetical protein
MWLLTVQKSGQGAGTVTSNMGVIDCGATCSDTYNDGTEVILTATPEPNSRFTGWSENVDCEDGVVTMTTDVNCTANFYSFPWPMFVPAMTGKAQP